MSEEILKLSEKELTSLESIASSRELAASLPDADQAQLGRLVLRNLPALLAEIRTLRAEVERMKGPGVAPVDQPGVFRLVGVEPGEITNVPTRNGFAVFFKPDPEKKP